MIRDLARLCASHGIEPSYVGMDGKEHAVPRETLAGLAEIFEIEQAREVPPAGIAEALAVKRPARCYIPAALRRARVWGLTCQLPSLASPRNLGIGDFADLGAFCDLAAAEGADFVGVNPLHALFWSDPARVSPFFPSNRRFLNPLYVALDWLDGFAGLAPEEEAEAGRLRGTGLVDFVAVAQLKHRLLRRLFERFAWSDRSRRSFRDFCAEGGEPLAAHALFEALSDAMVAEGCGAGWLGWAEPFRYRDSGEVRAFAENNRDAVDYHLWLQWVADGQLARVQHAARRAGMRIGLYLDFAVGAAPDGSASWTDPHLTVPEVSVGAPPDDLAAEGQDWGLAPLSPVRLDALEGRPFADVVAAVMRHGGAMRLDHAMGIARLWLIPRAAPGRKGAYVRYPLTHLLARLAEVSRATGTVVIGEDLGTVPEGFRELMAKRKVHAYKVFLIERGPSGFVDPAKWPVDALACIATHDMPTFTGWWLGADLDLRRDLGVHSERQRCARRSERSAEKRALAGLLGASGKPEDASVRLHAHVAGSRCRLFALQIEDALGRPEQVNVPGTLDEYPNWRRRLAVPVDRIASDPIFRAHVAAIRGARPR